MTEPVVDWSPDREQCRFIRAFGDKVVNGEAGLFVGAGVSRAAGYVDWKGLLTDVAEHLDLDVTREHDLLALAQYHENAVGGRGELSQQLMDAFTRDVNPTAVHEVLARLPIDTVWTTNYDQLLEKAYEAAGRQPEVKLSIENLAQARRGRDVTLYKMHGCVTQPHGAVLTKQDYEIYDVHRRLFTDSLKGDFVEKTLLFLGFSFSDPNVERILSKVREQLGQNLRPHYWITRRPSHSSADGSEEQNYEARKAKLQSVDLRRYGVQTVGVDDYAHVPLLLRALEAYVTRRGVLVSGAAHDPAPFGQDKLNELSRLLGTEIVRHDFHLVSGFGIGIAEQAILGAFRAVYETQRPQPADRVRIRPFPGSAPAAQRAQIYTRHREHLMSQVGAVVVLAGNKKAADGTVIPSNGVEEEVAIGLRLGKPIIPIGATGHIAERIWREAILNPDKYLPGIMSKDELAVLGSNDATAEQLVQAAMALLERAERRASTRPEV